MSVVTEIRTVRRGSKRRLVLLDDEPWRIAPADVLREAGLQVGDTGTDAEMVERLSKVEGRSARDRAVRLLTYRDRSSAELMVRLDEDGYLPQVAADTVTRLLDLGLLDDDRFARALARSLTRTKGLGRSRASREMIARGVDPDAVSAVLEEALPPEDEENAALAQARVFARRVGATRDRVAARLMRKGYAPRIALSAAREACEAIADGPDDGGWDTADPPADDMPF
ncbi:MAG TPA: RecX family transcriptional regulator [Coriobacteriia bacterium]